VDKEVVPCPELVCQRVMTVSSTVPRSMMNNGNFDQYQSPRRSPPSSCHPTASKRSHPRGDVSDVFDKPLPKRRRVNEEKMSARLRNFHLNPELAGNSSRQQWFCMQPMESFQDIEDRLSDSSATDSLEDEVESDEGNAQETVKLSDELEKYIKRTRNRPVLIIEPKETMALVPWSPSIISDYDRSMSGRIREVVDEDDDMGDVLSSPSHIQFPDDSASEDELLPEYEDDQLPGPSDSVIKIQSAGPSEGTPSPEPADLSDGMEID